MTDIGFFVFESSTGRKEVVPYGDEKSADLNSQDAAALALIYLSERISAHFDSLNDKLHEIVDKIGEIGNNIDMLKDRLDNIEDKLSDS